MQQMQLDLIRHKKCNIPDAPEHLFSALARQTENEVNADPHPLAMRPQCRISVAKRGIPMPAVNALGGTVIGGLQSKFHGQCSAFGNIGEQCQNIFRQAVGTCSNAHADNAGLRQGFLVFLTKQRHRRVGIGMRLEIGDTPCGIPLV